MILLKNCCVGVKQQSLTRSPLNTLCDTVCYSDLWKVSDSSTYLTDRHDIADIIVHSALVSLNRSIVRKINRHINVLLISEMTGRN